MHNTTVWPYPKMVAHRGAGKLAPENTLSAFRLGAQFGYRMAEYDAKLSSDEIVILMHDSGLERTTNGHGQANDLSFSELACLDAGSWHSAHYAGEAIPTLSAVARYTLANGIASNIEIKPTPGFETKTGKIVAAQARELWKNASIPPLLSSFSIEALQAAQKEAPELPRGYLTEKLPYDWLAILTSLGCVSIHLRQDAVTKEVIQQIQSAGFRVAIWTVNDANRSRELLEWGADSIITDLIDQIHP